MNNMYFLLCSLGSIVTLESATGLQKPFSLSTLGATRLLFVFPPLNERGPWFLMGPALCLHCNIHPPFAAALQHKKKCCQERLSFFEGGERYWKKVIAQELFITSEIASLQRRARPYRDFLFFRFLRSSKRLDLGRLN